MEEQFNMIFYFTATGNSLYVAKEMVAHPISIAQAIHDKEKVYCADQIGMVCPVYGHEMPELVKEFLKVSRFETGYFYILLTYGNRHGGAAELAKEYVEGLGLHPAYINVVLMADNFLPGFDMEEQKRLVEDYDVILERCFAQNMGGGKYKSNLLDNLETIREIGYEHVMVDTDGGQTENPNWEIAMAEYMQYLIDHGVPEEQVYYMTKTIPSRLLGLEVQD